ncbi:carbohydrate kinase family protein [Shewanella psychrotolerans]|uniref:carbohydrate kinase family protein n=1 Tax=Shewanella psychrotolerans TaxID=2864206 RepID=UPI001C65F77B|nr:carbohydrate kinase [Shewanella psychrotolerans]QYK02561.1 carbohydrate kinase [Shewanella psychrotolerans]
MTALLSFGEVLVDLLPIDARGSQHQPIAGGAPANVAVGFAKLGGRSLFAGGISTDEYGVMLQEALAQYCVATDYLIPFDGAPTATVLVSLDSAGERSFSFNRNGTADMLFRSEHFDMVDWDQIDIFHFCSNSMTDDESVAATFYGIQLAYCKSKLVSFDVNLRPSLWSDTKLMAMRVERCYRYTHLLKLSRDEALYLADNRGVSLEEYWHYCIELGVECILVTNGDKEVQCVTSHTQFTVAVPTIEVTDTTAAGDSFVAGFLYAIAKDIKFDLAHLSIRQRLESSDCLRSAIDFAARCGALTCSQKGAFPSLPHLELVAQL